MAHSFFKSYFTNFFFIINSWCSSIFRFVKLNCFEIDSNNSIWTVLSKKLYLNKFFTSKSFNSTAVFERNLAWLIVINNGHSSPSVFSFEIFICLRINKIDIEILIWLPVFIILNGNINVLYFLSLIKIKNFITLLIILSSKRFFIFSFNSDWTCIFGLVENMNSDASWSFRHWVV